LLENRKLSITVDRKEANSQPPSSNEMHVFEDKVVFIEKIVKDTIKTIFVGVCAYVVLDTARQMMVAKASQDLHRL
jgi:hypothetical protein